MDERAKNGRDPEEPRGIPGALKYSIVLFWIILISKSRIFLDFRYYALRQWLVEQRHIRRIDEIEFKLRIPEALLLRQRHPKPSMKGWQARDCYEWA